MKLVTRDGGYWALDKKHLGRNLFVLRSVPEEDGVSWNASNLNLHLIIQFRDHSNSVIPQVFLIKDMEPEVGSQSDTDPGVKLNHPNCR